jgi:RHS repeat-associated protein
MPKTEAIDQPLAMERGNTIDYYEHDGLGSVTSLTAANGSIAQTYTYDSYGNLTNSSGSLTNFFRYTGREFDTETNLYYYRARYYDPSSGRFANEDPIRFRAGANFYRYVNNSPVLLIDPTGFCPPPQTPQKQYDQCMAGFDNSTVGKAVQFGSLLSFATNFWNTATNWAETIIGKGSYVKIAEVAGQSLQPAGEVTPVTTVAKPIVGDLALAGVAIATVTDAEARSACYQGANPDLYQYTYLAKW